MITPEERQYLIEIYDVVERNSRNATNLFLERFGHSVSKVSVVSVWKKSGLEIKSRGGAQTRDRKTQINYVKSARFYRS